MILKNFRTDIGGFYPSEKVQEILNLCVSVISNLQKEIKEYGFANTNFGNATLEVDNFEGEWNCTISVKLISTSRIIIEKSGEMWASALIKAITTAELGVEVSSLYDLQKIVEEMEKRNSDCAFGWECTEMEEL